MNWVLDLIDREMMIWRRDIIEHTFLHHDVQAILLIPLSFRRTQNNIIWHFDLKVVCSVKTVYHLAKSLVKGG